MSSATSDSRFRPIKNIEFPELSATVSVLSDFTEIDDPYDWNVGIHGIYATFHTHQLHKDRDIVCTATFLPNVPLEQGWDQRRAIEELKRKAGVAGQAIDAVTIQIYQSQTHTLHWDDYKNIVV